MSSLARATTPNGTLGPRELGLWQPCGDKTLAEAIVALAATEHPDDVLRRFGFEPEHVTTPSGKELLVFDGEERDLYGANRRLVVDWDGPSPCVALASDFVRELGDEVYDYLPAPDFNDDFWREVGNGGFNSGELYHGSRSESVASILSSGLECRDQTRGLTNGATGPAIFTTASSGKAGEYASDSGEVVIEIDVGRMMADGFTPQVAQEYPVALEEQQAALASLLGVEEWSFDPSSDGLDPDTIVFFEDIPARYLRLGFDGEGWLD